MKSKVNPYTSKLQKISEASDFDGDFVNVSGDTMNGDLRGTDFVKTRSITINRDTDGYVSSIEKTDGRTITITRDANNVITSFTDGTNTWTITRSGDQITSIDVS